MVALQKGRAQFLARYAGGFLIRRGTEALPVPRSDDDEDSISRFRTAMYDTARVQRGAVPAAIEPARWLAVAVARAPASPYEDRISVGRTRNCDITLRFTTVSKRHAHFWCAGAAVTHLSDNSSANGTFVNGRRLPAKERVAVAHGDRVTFGDLELEFISAQQFYEMIAPPGPPR